MRFEKTIMTSRRAFSNALGTALVTASTWPIRAEARSMRGQSGSSTSKSRRTTQKVSLRWDAAEVWTTVWSVIFQLLQSGAVKPIVAKTFPLAEAAEALRYLVEGRPFGRVVLTI